MQFLEQLGAEDRDRCLRVLSAVADVRTHQDLCEWLGSQDMQKLLPHDIAIMAWGDIRTGLCQLDTVSPLPGARTAPTDTDKLRPRIQQIFQRWLTQQQPCALDADVLNGVFASLVLSGRSVLVHGLHDQRSDQHSCYVLVLNATGHVSQASEALAALLPYIDIGFRQATIRSPMAVRPAVPSYHDNAPSVHRVPAEQITLQAASNALSAMAMTERELQIMRWVEMGKTNQEIGSILHISAFTVKNHLQRIFKKLDVYSRAQAVSRFKDSMLYG